MQQSTSHNHSQASFAGIIPPVTTPFDEDGAVVWPALKSNLERYIEKPVSGVLMLGSNGEAAHLATSERLQAVQLACETLPRDRRILVGVSFAALTQAVDFVESLEGLPVDALLTSVPTYYKNRMSDEALEAYFLRLAEAAPAPLLLYNVPQYSGLALSPELVVRLAAHPGIVGMKDSWGNFGYLQKILYRTRDADFQVLLGSAQIFGPSLGLGIRAAILAVACALPELPALMLEAYRRDEDISALQEELFTIAEALTSRFGVAGVKYAMDLLGWKGGLCRLPLLPLKEPEMQDIENALSQSRLAAKLLEAV
ncbi:MAG TPA: dihydrodipicolinate synthase family protein [Acidobacteriota bacterium]|nr:dihydrodipicolinate synthase family protein [Acidobacteriota bacterium]